MVDEKNGVEKSETNSFSFEVSENKEDIKERMSKLETAIMGLNKLQFGSFRKYENEGLTIDETQDFKKRLEMALSQEIQLLDKVCERDLKAGEKNE